MRRLLRSLLASLLLLVVVPPVVAEAAPAGSTLLVSRPDRGPAPSAFDGFSSAGAISADGRYAVFASSADGFAAGVNPKVTNLFLRDTQTGETTLVSRSDGPEGVGVDRDARFPALAVTPAGHVLVAFDTEATNLSDHETGPVTPPEREEEVWLRDVTAGTTTLISRGPGAGAPANRFAVRPSIGITAGGPVVAFQSGGTNLGVNSGGVFLRTVDARTTQLISCKNRDCGTPRSADGGSAEVQVVPSAAGTLCSAPLHPTGACVLVAFDTAEPTISGDGSARNVVVAAATAPAVSGAAPGPANSFLVASLSEAGVRGNSGSFGAKLSADGRAVAFTSFATNLTADAHPPNLREAYVRRIDGTAIELVSKGGPVADRDVQSVDLGGTAARLKAVFQTSATNLGGTGSQTYLRDLGTGTTSLLNRAPGPDGGPGDASSSGSPVISADGSAALFDSNSSNIGEEGGRFTRVRVRRLADPAQPVELVSRPSGTVPLDVAADESFLPGAQAVSADGRFVVFNALADLTGDAGPRRVENVYVRDLLTSRTVLVSRADGATGAATNADAFASGISADGRKVVFVSGAGNLDPDAKANSFQVYLRDLDANRTTLLSRGADGKPGTANSFGARISADGRTVLIGTTEPFDPAAADGQNHFYVRDLASGSMTLADRDSGAAGTIAATSSSGGSIDATGSRVAFASTASLAGAPADGKLHAFVRDLRTGLTSLVSRADGLDGASATGDSFSPEISASGDVVAFVSAGQNLGVTFPRFQVFARDVDAGHTELISGGTTLPTTASRPSISADGNRITFTAEGAGDATPGPEVFLRDRAATTTELVSRADGLDGEPAVSELFNSAISPNGDCVAFDGRVTNLNAGFSSPEFESVHMRVVRGECPQPVPQPGPGAGPGGAGGGGGPTTAAPKPVVLSSLKLTPTRFATSGRRRGTKISYKLTRAARVTVRIERLTTGRRKGTRCVSRGRGKRCTIVKSLGTFGKSGRAGTNRISFSGTLKSKRLARGRYRLTATPTAGRGQKKTFLVIATPPVRGRGR